MYQCVVIKFNVISIEEKYLIFDMWGSAYVGELFPVFNPPVSINIPIWFVIYCPVQWDVEVEIFGVPFGLVQNDGWHEALPIGLGKYNECAP